MMRETTEPLEGGCRCGRVRFSTTSRPFLTMACHCTGCQRMTGSAFSLSALIAGNGFALTLGEPVIGGLHGASRHFFCQHCMSWLFTRPEGVDFVSVRATMLDHTGDFVPFIETYTSEQLPWAATPAPHRFEKFPAPEEFPALMENYARWTKPTA